MSFSDLAHMKQFCHFFVPDLRVLLCVELNPVGIIMAGGGGGCGCQSFVTEQIFFHFTLIVVDTKPEVVQHLTDVLEGYQTEGGREERLVPSSSSPHHITLQHQV